MRFLVLALVLFTLAGCGGYGDDDDGEAATGAARGESVSVSLVDFAIEPKTVTVDQAGTYTFEATNDGQTEHALEVEGGDLEEETDTLAPGESGEVTVELAAGEYELYCPIDGHRDQGMEGTLTVR